MQLVFQLRDELVIQSLDRNGLDLKEYLANLEKDLIEQALGDSGGVVARAANRLHIRRTTLVEKIRKYGLQKKQAADDQEQSDEKSEKEDIEAGQAASG